MAAALQIAGQAVGTQVAASSCPDTAPRRAWIEVSLQRGVDVHYRIDSPQLLFTGCSEGLMYVIARYGATNAGQEAICVNLVVVKRTAQGWRIVTHEAAVPDPATAVQRLDLPDAH